MTEEIKQRIVEDELKESYLDYSMSVIVNRALPDVRDGLKPVHRRILYSMHDMGLTNNKPFVKSARIVGDCFKYHPHGDMSIYDSLVRMAQNFSLRYCLVNGHGNFGSVDFPQAHMRYTEARLTKLSEEMLVDIDKDTVDFVPNFDASLKEPAVLPSKIPNLLINGSSGIAVGMATNIPPHNISEVIDSVIAFIDNNEITVNEILNNIKGPDFPTGGIICGLDGIKEAYETGKGKIILRGKAICQEKKIIVNEIPYQVSKSSLIENIVQLVRDDVLEGISDIRDESDRDGMRIVISVKQGYDCNLVLNQLYKHTSLQTTFGIILLALVDNEPKILSLKNCISEYVKHRKEVVTRRTKFELNKSEKRVHILAGLKIAIENIDDVVRLVKKSKSAEFARTNLISSYNLSNDQAQAILDMKLQRLTSLEHEGLIKEYDGLIVYIAELMDILSNVKRIFDIVKDELIDLKNKYKDERKTLIVEEYREVEEEKLVEEEEVIVTLTNHGYIKRMSLDLYKQQKRGGKGIISTVTKEGDFIEQLFVVNTRDILLCFSNNGKVHWLNAYDVPESARYGKGVNLVNLLNLGKDERINTIIPVRNFDGYLVMCTKKGIIKKTALNEFSKPRRGGVAAINLREDDKLVNVALTDGNRDIMIATRNGLAVRFSEGDVSVIGRAGMGVRGIKLKMNDYVIGMDICNREYVLSISEDGFGKRTKLDEYSVIKRGGSGVINLNVEKGGYVAGVKLVNDNDEVMFITKNGVVIRVNVNDISLVGRNAKGVRLIKLDKEDKVIGLAKVSEDNKDFTLGGY